MKKSELIPVPTSIPETHDAEALQPGLLACSMLYPAGNGTWAEAGKAGSGLYRVAIGRESWPLTCLNANFKLNEVGSSSRQVCLEVRSQCLLFEGRIHRENALHWACAVASLEAVSGGLNEHGL